MKISELPTTESLMIGDTIPIVRDSITYASSSADHLYILYSPEVTAIDINTDGGSTTLFSPDANSYIELSDGSIDINPGTGNHLYLSYAAIANNSTPTGLNDALGTAGSLSWDDDYLYLKTSGGWARVALTLLAP